MLTTLIVLAFATLAQAENSCLSSHNKLRALHEQTGPMVWDTELAAGATEWAQKLASEGGLSHSVPEGAYGENLYSSTGAAPNCAKATLAWYNEIKDYDFSNGRFTMATGHFTQVVWKASTKLGVGIAQIGNRVVICARYAPPGNYNSRFAANVLPQKEGAKIPTLAELEANIMSVTAGPVTAGPVTEGPVTEEPMTEGPVTEAPVTEGPVTEGPVTEGPVTEEPMTEGPMTEGPVREEPMTEGPMTEGPVTEEPMTEGPVTEGPVTEGPVTEGPEPMTKPPGCKDISERCSKFVGKKCKGWWARKKCPKTCNTCKKPKPTGEPAVCEDKSEKCSKVNATNCGRWARKACPKTCNTCKKPKPTGEPAAEITDLAELESDIMADTEGPMTGEPMTGEPMTGEPMTEGPMTEGPMTEGPESMTKPPGCQDKSQKCSKFVGKKCKGWWARKACRKTCNTCKKPKPTGEPAECEDRSERCKNFVGKKCGGWAKNKCPKTCNVCSAPMTTGIPAPTGME